MKQRLSKAKKGLYLQTYDATEDIPIRQRKDSVLSKDYKSACLVKQVIREKSGVYIESIIHRNFVAFVLRHLFFMHYIIV